MSVRKGTSWRRRAVERIAARDGRICSRCGAAERFTYAKGGVFCTPEWHRYQVTHRVSTLQLDHDLALHLGGSNDDSNLQLLCMACHKAKSVAEHSSRLKRLFAEARA